MFLGINWEHCPVVKGTKKLLKNLTCDHTYDEELTAKDFEVGKIHRRICNKCNKLQKFRVVSLNIEEI